MRLIGHLKSEASAKTFGDYLSGIQIKNVMEPEADGTWAVWIYSEDHLDSSREMLNAFESDPENPKYKQAAEKAAALKDQERRAQEDFEKRFRTKDGIWPSVGLGHVTIILIGICVLVAIYSKLGDDLQRISALFISEYRGAGLPEIRNGEAWRLLTPVFIHMDVLHLLFNMLWLKDLGSQIEARQGPVRLLLLILIFAIPSNLGQYLTDGPRFGGMSGVVYGLLGYIWMRGRFSPGSGLYIQPQIIVMMLVWFFVCLFVLVDVANTAHAVGLVMGVILGYLPTLYGSVNRR